MYSKLFKFKLWQFFVQFGKLLVLIFRFLKIIPVTIRSVACKGFQQGDARSSSKNQRVQTLAKGGVEGCRGFIHPSKFFIAIQLLIYAFRHNKTTFDWVKQTSSAQSFLPVIYKCTCILQSIFHSLSLIIFEI